ncbi:TPA: leucine--tRNA ligase, partial [Patescibacteria group bacterium]|nr:leucine--tRNA ligase [Candidatus Gracilibacteria bacterium]
MPGWAGSSWYRLRYMDNKNDAQLVSPEREQYWKSVDVYVGGAEHVTRHMIYARFWQKFLFDIGVVTQEEPFQKYQKVGLIMAEDGRKMSKRRNNVVLPDDVIGEYGADAFRTYEMFMGPFDQAISRSTNGIKGIKKFLDKIIALHDKISPEALPKQLETIKHQTIKKLTEDIDEFKFNTAISQLMIFVNALSDASHIDKDTFQDLILLIAPFAPHLAEEF